MEYDLKTFYQEFMDIVTENAIDSNTTKEQESTSLIIEYIKEDGFVLAPELINCFNPNCTNRSFEYYRVNAFDYSEESGILDLFISVYFDKFEIQTLTRKQIDKAVNEITHFFNLAIEGSLSKIYKNNDPDVYDVVDLIKEAYQKNQIDTIRFFILSNGANKEEYTIDDITITEKNINCEYQVWDIEAVRKCEMSRRQANDIDIDLANVYHTPIECLEMHDQNNSVKSYLAIMPAITLAHIYSKHKTRLIDQNVRNFLGGKIKVNKTMAQTLRENPDMFFSYNNGISSTADKVTTELQEGKLQIINLKNWHIVNGGQTTNTIYNAYKQRSVDLTKAFVAMKVSEIKNDANGEIVANIAKYANSQTQIKDSDLCANHPYMIKLDAISKKEWVPNNSCRTGTQWFFERMRGQYLSEVNNIGGSTTAKARKFIKAHPKKQVFAKTDIAKLEMSWKEYPYIASRGGEVCFDKFWDMIIKKENQEVDKTYFHRLIAKAILYETIDSLFKESGNKGYGNIINNYVLATLSLKSQNNLNLDAIWEKQSVPENIKDIIKKCIDIVADYIKGVAADGNKNPSVLAKKPDFWNTIKIKMAQIPQFDNSLLYNQNAEELTEEQIRTINSARNISISTWEDLAVWGKQTRKLSIMEKKKIEHIAVAIEKENTISFNFASDCLHILEKSKDNGFTEQEKYY